jgi:hypothetical protein
MGADGGGDNAHLFSALAYVLWGVTVLILPLLPPFSWIMIIVPLMYTVLAVSLNSFPFVVISLYIYNFFNFFHFIIYYHLIISILLFYG